MAGSLRDPKSNSKGSRGSPKDLHGIPFSVSHLTSIAPELRLRCHLECCLFLAVKLVRHSDSSDARSRPYTVRTDCAPKVRFSATLGQEPKIVLACVMPISGTEALRKRGGAYHIARSKHVSSAPSWVRVQNLSWGFIVF
jgi:hypothetical protein